MAAKHCILVDIDSTLADVKHREHHVKHELKKHNNWTAFYDALGMDLPIMSTIEKVQSFYRQGLTVILCTGRPDKYLEQTKLWLSKFDVPYHKLIMKTPPHYRTKAPIWKANVVCELQDLGYNIKLAIDDDPSVREIFTMLNIKSIEPLPY